jgi:hypothetical protein
MALSQQRSCSAIVPFLSPRHRACWLTVHRTDVPARTTCPLHHSSHTPIYGSRRPSVADVIIQAFFRTEPGTSSGPTSPPPAGRDPVAVSLCLSPRPGVRTSTTPPAAPERRAREKCRSSGQPGGGQFPSTLIPLPFGVRTSGSITVRWVLARADALSTHDSTAVIATIFLSAQGPRLDAFQGVTAPHCNRHDGRSVRSREGVQ